MAKKRLSVTEKLRRTVTREYKSLQGRKYNVDENIFEKIKTAKWQTLKKLQRERYKNVTYGEGESQQSGEERRKQERSEAAHKGAETKQKKKQGKPEPDYPQLGVIIYNRIVQIANSAGTMGARILGEVMAREIAQHDAKSLFQSLADAPETAVQLATDIASYESSDFRTNRAQSALARLVDLMRGTTRSAEDAKDIGEYMEGEEDYDE